MEAFPKGYRRLRDVYTLPLRTELGEKNMHAWEVWVMGKTSTYDLFIERNKIKAARTLSTQQT